MPFLGQVPSARIQWANFLVVSGRTKSWYTLTRGIIIEWALLAGCQSRCPIFFSWWHLQGSIGKRDSQPLQHCTYFAHLSRPVSPVEIWVQHKVLSQCHSMTYILNSGGYNSCEYMMSLLGKEFVCGMWLSGKGQVWLEDEWKKAEVQTMAIKFRCSRLGLGPVSATKIDQCISSWSTIKWW